MIDKKIGLEKHRVYIESSYELTEDERVIAQVLLNVGYISLYRADGDLLCVNDENGDWQELWVFDFMFKFIKWGERAVSLEELLGNQYIELDSLNLKA